MYNTHVYIHRHTYICLYTCIDMCILLDKLVKLNRCSAGRHSYIVSEEISLVSSLNIIFVVGYWLYPLVT